MSDMRFKEFLRASLKEVIGSEDIKKLFEVLCKNTSDFYNGRQVNFCERFTKRIEYVTGYGEESFIPQEKIELDGRYLVLLQGFEDVPDCERELLVSLFKIAAASSKIK